MPVMNPGAGPMANRCEHPEHNIPSVENTPREPGMYDHQCPRCRRLGTYSVGPDPTQGTRRPSAS
jgi:hypothetical protein